MKKSIFFRSALSREITITLVIKIILIALIWWAFFSDPLDDRLDSASVGSAVFGSPEMNEGAVPATPADLHNAENNLNQRD